MTREIPLNDGTVALVDDVDYPQLVPYKWYIEKPQETGSKSVYVYRTTYLGGGKYTTTRLHRLILGLARFDPRQGDHINFDTRDNRRTNLRIVTPKDNARRRNSRAGSTSRYVGVRFVAKQGSWRAQVKMEGRFIDCGTHSTEESAARARDAWVRAHRSGHTLNSPLAGEG